MNKSNILISHLLVSLAVVLSTNSALAQTFESGSEQVPLIELYTSEGCSSCPPADRWMTRLLDQEDIWDNYVPVVFHVDYWDYIGWPDRFASKEYSQRQRRYAAEFKETTVYTPGMRKAGELWRNWLRTPAPKLTNADDVGTLQLDVNKHGHFIARFSATQTDRHSNQITIALLGLGLSTDVKRGENAGKTLEHNFVVLSMSTFANAQTNTWRGEIPKPSIPAPNYAIAAWVTQGGSLKPIQAVGGKLDASFLSGTFPDNSH